MIEDKKQEITFAVCPHLGVVKKDPMTTVFELGPVTVKPFKMIDFKLPYIKFRYGKNRKVQ